MNISEILRNATPEQLEEIRAFMASLDDKSWNRPFSRVDMLSTRSYDMICHRVGLMALDEVYTSEAGKLIALRCISPNNFLDKLICNKQAHQEAEIFAKACSLKLAHEFNKYKSSDAPSSNFPFF